jgi:superfamily I DNA/RNA helicase
MRTVIAGPPGTGKTHTLIHKHLYNELIVNKTDPKKICYITFSNAAANEAKERIQKEYPTFEFDWICTMHSMGTKMLSIDTTTQLLKDKIGMHLKINMDTQICILKQCKEKMVFMNIKINI